MVPRSLTSSSFLQIPGPFSSLFPACSRWQFIFFGTAQHRRNSGFHSLYTAVKLECCHQFPLGEADAQGRVRWCHHADFLMNRCSVCQIRCMKKDGSVGSVDQEGITHCSKGGEIYFRTSQKRESAAKFLVKAVIILEPLSTNVVSAAHAHEPVSYSS